MNNYLRRWTVLSGYAPRSLSVLCCVVISLTFVTPSHAENLLADDLLARNTIESSPLGLSPSEVPPLKGWDYLAGLMVSAGFLRHEVEQLFSDPRMPGFDTVFFSLNPRESAAMYRDFTRDNKRLLTGAEFLRRNEKYFSAAEKKYQVSRYVVAAILLVETNFGEFTGKSIVFHRLARLASVRDPKNLAESLAREQEKDPSVTLAQMDNRGKYLEETFFPEIKALVTLSKAGDMDVFDLRGSSAGAFGMAQFLPSSFLKFGVDGNNDGTISLYTAPDAITSVAHYLAAAGWKDNGKVKIKRQAIWAYNRSEPYIDAVLGVAELLRKQAQPKTKLKQKAPARK